MKDMCGMMIAVARHLKVPASCRREIWCSPSSQMKKPAANTARSGSSTIGPTCSKESPKPSAKSADSP